LAAGRLCLWAHSSLWTVGCRATLSPNGNKV
jgi:hypothetical protein